MNSTPDQEISESPAASPAAFFRGTPGDLEIVDTDSPLAQVQERSCNFYQFAYWGAHQEAQAAGKGPEAHVYEFLHLLCTFRPKFDTPADPYGPFFMAADRRGVIPADLRDSDLDAVAVLARRTRDPALQARCFDLLWLRWKRPEDCTAAAQAYLAAVEPLDGSRTFDPVLLRRGLFLAAQLGRDKPLYQEIGAKAIGGARSVNQQGFLLVPLMQILLDFYLGDPAEFAALAASQAEAGEQTQEFFRVLRFRQLEAQWQRRAKNQEGERTALRALAEYQVRDAMARATGEHPVYIVAARLLAQAIEALRRAGGSPERIAQLKALLVEYQGQTHQDFRPIVLPPNIAEDWRDELQRNAEAVIRHVSGKHLNEAILRLSFAAPLINPEKLREQVKETMAQTPLMSLFQSTTLDRDGRTVALTPGMSGATGETAEQVIDDHCFRDAARFIWPSRVQGVIEPGRWQVHMDHHPSFADLEFLVMNNPFVPPGHEGLFLRGLHAGFHGDFIVATHVLVPQIENSLRYVLESQGVDVTNLRQFGIEDQKVLGPLLGMEKSREIFGEELIFELRGLLIEKTGYSFRNQLAHGFLQEGECQSVPGILVWWLVMRLCAVPLLQGSTAQAAANADGE